MSHDRSFTSDNISPVSAPIWAALEAANHGAQASYGNDEWSPQLTELARAVFETDLDILPVSTGTAANALALSALLDPYECILCHESAHLVTDECGAIPFYTAGSPFLLLKGVDGKITPADVTAAVRRANSLGIHHSKPKVLSLAQANEWGRVYTIDELTALCDTAHRCGLWVHMDGARFANALVALNATPRALSQAVGVDVLSCGATKNGALAAEAVISFRPELSEKLLYRRKRAGLLQSKMRFAAAQWLGYFKNDHWLDNARHANQLATRLAHGIKPLPQVTVIHPVEANEVFIHMSQEHAEQLQAQGFGFYDWPSPNDQPLWRLVTRFDQSVHAVDELIRAIAALR